MIQFEQFRLDNGLQVYVLEDKDVQIANINILYNVGSRDEHESKTGFAHLFEHLMFGGSKNISSYDEPLQKVGGENNAFTNSDITNYYLTLPANNIETGFWLESDRMLSLSFDPSVLEVQRNVVIEEFKQRYLNQPYGDLWLKLRPLAYQVHPYKWATIGKEISHIENATQDDVKNFFFKYYVPQNAIMVVAGNVNTSEIKRLSEKWFGPIPGGNPIVRDIPAEPRQEVERKLVHEVDVPQDAINKAYHMCGRIDNEYYATDLLSDILGRGKSSRLYDRLVKKEKLFSNIHAYVMGSVDPGLFVISGNLNSGCSIEEGDQAIQSVIDSLDSNLPDDNELGKVKNQAESTIIFSEVELLNKAMNIAFGASIGNPNLINEESKKISEVTSRQIETITGEVLRESNCSTLYYKSIS